MNQLINKNTVPTVIAVSLGVVLTGYIFKTFSSAPLLKDARDGFQGIR